MNPNSEQLHPAQLPYATFNTVTADVLQHLCAGASLDPERIAASRDAGFSLWLWDDVFPIDQPTLLAGPPGVGKSFLALDIAARVSRGVPMPFAPHRPPLPPFVPRPAPPFVPAPPDAPLTPSPPPPLIPPSQPAYPAFPSAKSVLLFAPEDPHLTIINRLRAQGADLTRIHFVHALNYFKTPQSEQKRPPTMRQTLEQDLTADHLADALHALTWTLTKIQNCGLVIIDPLHAFLGASAGRASTIRALFTKLTEEARNRRIPILLIAHTGPGRRGEDRLLGPAVLSVVPRTIWHLQFLQDRRTRIFLPAKANLANPPAFTFKIDSPSPSAPCGGGAPSSPSAPGGGGPARLCDAGGEGVGTSSGVLPARLCDAAGEGVAEDAAVPAASDPDPPVTLTWLSARADLSHTSQLQVGDLATFDDACAFFQSELAEGPRLALELTDLSEQLGHKPRTLALARKHLGIKSIKLQGASNNPWVVTLPRGRLQNRVRVLRNLAP